MTKFKATLELEAEIRNDEPTIKNLAEKIATQLHSFIDGGSKRLIKGTVQEIYLVDIEHNRELYELMQRIGLISEIKRRVRVIDLYGNPAFYADVCYLTTKAKEVYSALQEENRK